jgi:hypothetical protein
MIRRRSTIGLWLLCALAFSAFEAQSASAADEGTTAFTCKEKIGAAEGFEEAHCDKATKEKAKVKFVHEEIALGAETKVTTSNANTANNTTEHTTAVLVTKLFILPAAITCTKVHGEDGLTNNNAAPMNVTGSIRLKFTECEAHVETKPGVFVTCEVISSAGVKGEITAEATAETPFKAMEVKFNQVGTALSAFEVRCSAPLGTVSVKVTGSATATPEGATLRTTKASTEPPGGAKCFENRGLCANGQFASLESLITTTMSTTESGIALTTT